MFKPPSESKESYAHGYDSALTHQLHTGTTAIKHAAFFLPYLQPGMLVIDCGCGSGAITLGLAKPERLDALQAVWLQWSKRPDALCAIAHGEAVGRKAQDTD